MGDAKKSSRFGLGLILGSLVGSVAGIFLTPKSGKKMREVAAHKLRALKKKLNEKEIQSKVEKIFGEVSEEGIKLYTQAREELIKRLAEFKDKIDIEKFEDMVKELLDELKNRTKTSAEKINKLRLSLMMDMKNQEEDEKK